MANIGSFTADKDGFTGTLRTLTLNVKVKLVPNDKGDNEKAPDFRLQAASHDIGAAWKKTSEAGREYISVTLDDPSFPATVYARLIEGEDGTHDLIWSRSKPHCAPSHGGALRCSFVPNEAAAGSVHCRLRLPDWEQCLRLRPGHGVSARCAAGLYGLRPAPSLPSRPFGFNPSRLRACGAARFACSRGSELRYGAALLIVDSMYGLRFSMNRRIHSSFNSGGTSSADGAKPSVFNAPSLALDMASVLTRSSLRA